MSSKVLGWRTRIYILYTSTYPEVLDTTIWAKPIKVSPSDLLFGFAYWHNLVSIREEWNTYDMIGVVAVEQCSPTYITKISKALTDDMLLKTGYHQFTMDATNRKYSPLFQGILNKYCKPPLSSNTKTSTYNAWICSSVKMDRFIEWFSTKLTPFIAKNPIDFEEMVTLGDSMKVNDEPAPYALITTMLVEKLIMGYFAVDRIDDKMNLFFTNDYARELERLEKHEQLKLTFAKSVEPIQKPVKPLPEEPEPEPVPVYVPHIVERMQEEYRATQAEREKIEAEEMAARSILNEEMMRKAIKESELLATLQKTIVIKSTIGTTITSEIAGAKVDDIRHTIDEEIHRARLQAEADTEEYRKGIDKELAALRQKAEDEMISSIRTAELDSIRQIQQQTNSSVTRIREETERKVATAKATLEREKKALERAKLMRLELETSRDAAIREAEETVQQMRAIEKETRKYAHLLEQANSSRKRYEAERAMLVKQIDVETKFIHSSIAQMETLNREKEERIRKSRQEAEEKMRTTLAKAEEEAAEARKQTELEVLAERQKREQRIREELRIKENEYFIEKRREDAAVEADIKARRAEYLQQKKVEDERVLNELKEKELEQARERDRELEQFANEKRKNDEEFARNRIELLEQLKVDHERALAEVKASTAESEARCDELLDALAHVNSRKEEIKDHINKIMLELHETITTSTTLEENIFATHLRISDMTETIERLKHDTKVIQPKLEQIEVTKAAVVEEYEIYKHQLEELTIENNAAVALLVNIEKEVSEKKKQRQHIEQQHSQLLDEINANTLAISVTEQTIEAIKQTITTLKTNISSLILSKENAEQAVIEMNHQIGEHTIKYEECEHRRKSVNEELASTLVALTAEQSKLAKSECNLTERKHQLQTTLGLIEVARVEFDSITAQNEEVTFKYTTMKEKIEEINQNIRQISDTSKMLDQSYIELVATNQTMMEQQAEKRARNAAENKSLVEKRADLAELEKAFRSDHDMLKSAQETYQMAIAEHETIHANRRQLEEETVVYRREKFDLEQQAAAMVTSISHAEHELVEIRARIWEQEAILAKLKAEKQVELIKKAESADAVARAKFDERIRKSLNERMAAKRRALEEYQELLHVQSQQAQNQQSILDKAAQARKRALDEAIAARTHIEQNPVRIYILCHNAERFEKAGSIYRKYPWARPILMKYQDCTFENAVWKQLYEIRDEWYNYKMVGTMSFSAYTKIDMNNVDRIVKDPNTWAAGFYHFMRTETPISNKHHPHLVEIMTDSCRALELPVPPENFCNYWITSSEKLIQFLIWYEERAYPTVMGHPLIMSDSTYPGSLSKDHLMKLCGVPYYPHTPFVFERLFLSFFMSLK